MICVSYTRTLSCVEEKEIPKDVISRQNRSIEEYAKGKGWKLSEKYSDRKKDPMEDAAFQKLWKDGVKRKFECVIFDSIFRFGRNVSFAQDVLVNVFAPAGIYFAVVEDDFCSIGKSLDEINAYMNERNKEYIANKFGKQFLKINETKTYYHYGFVCDGENMRMTIDPEAAEIVKEIFIRMSTGEKPGSIAKSLTQREIDSPRSYFVKKFGSWHKCAISGWNSSQVNNIAKDRSYTGVWERTINGEKRVLECPQIITQEMFDEVQNHRKARTVAIKRRIAVPNLFVNKIFDQETEIPLRYFDREVDKDAILRFRYPKPVEVSYDKGAISYALVIEQVFEKLKEECQSASEAKAFIETEDGALQKEKRLAPYLKEAEVVLTKWGEAETEGMMEYQLWSSGGIEDSSYISKAKMRKVQIEEFEEKLKGLEAEMIEIEKIYSKDNPWISAFAVPEIPEKITREDVNRWIERVDVFRFEYAQVTFKFEKWRQRLMKDQVEGEILHGKKK